MDMGPEEFDLFHSDEESVEVQRAFELWYRKQTGRSAIVIGNFEYKATLKYGDA